MVRAADTLNGRVYRGTQPMAGTYYTRPPKRAAREALRRWERLSHQLDGALRFTYDRLQEGWILMRRHRRFIDPKGHRREVKEWAAVEPDYELREVKRPPSYNDRAGHPTRRR